MKQLVFKLMRFLMTVVLATGLTLLVFMLLPIMQRVSDNFAGKQEVKQVVAVNTDPPPEVEEAVEEEEPPEIEEPPEMDEAPEPVSLDALAAALEGGTGAGFGGDFKINLGNLIKGNDGGEDMLMAMGNDKPAEVIYAEPPKYPPALRSRKISGLVVIRCIVDIKGKVTKASVVKSSNPAFDAPALAAFRKWKFKPGSRNGKPVPSRIKQSIRFVPPR